MLCLFVNCWVQGDVFPEFEDIPSKHSWNISLKSRKWMNGGIIIWSFCHPLSSSSLKTPILHSFLSVKTTLPNLSPRHFVKILRLPLFSFFFFYLRETLHAVPEPLFLHFFFLCLLYSLSLTLTICFAPPPHSLQPSLPLSPARRLFFPYLTLSPRPANRAWDWLINGCLSALQRQLGNLVRVERREGGRGGGKERRGTDEWKEPREERRVYHHTEFQNTVLYSVKS